VAGRRGRSRHRGLLIGFAIIPLVGKVIAPAVRMFKGRSVGAS
jgi:hypothetical protein